jgi:hypothetical protein
LPHRQLFGTPYGALNFDKDYWQLRQGLCLAGEIVERLSYLRATAKKSDESGGLRIG